MSSSKQLMAVALFFMVLSLFISISPYVPQMPQPVTHSPSSFQLTLEIAKKTDQNVTDYAFFVLNQGVMDSSAAINVPANVTIKLTIINKDGGIDKLLKASDANLTGSVNGFMTVAEYDQNSAFLKGEPVTSTPQNVSAISSGDISHTFSTDTGLNVPIPPSSEETLYVSFSTPGIYSWGCMCECGAFSMETPGWMYGTLVVS